MKANKNAAAQKTVNATPKTSTMKVLKNQEDEKTQIPTPAQEETTTPAELPQKTGEEQTTQPAPEKTKLELKKDVVVRNVESTVKIVEELHRLTIYRNNLSNTVDELDKFEIIQKEDEFHMDKNYYQGCRFLIEDGNGHRFETRNAALILDSAEHLKSRCFTKLAEVEAEIVLPVA